MCAWEQNRSLLTRGSSSRPSNKLCTSHTQIQWHADTQIHTLWIIHERGVSQSQWHAKSLTNAQRLTERQSLFYLDGGDHWCVCETVGGASVCVWVCVVSDVLYSARSFCLAKPSSLWPDYCLSPHPPPFLPLFFYTRLLFNFPPPAPSLFSFPVFITLCWWFRYPNGEEQKESWLWGRHVCALSYCTLKSFISQTPWERHMPSDGIACLTNK